MSERMYRVCLKTKDLRTIAVAWTVAQSMVQAMRRNMDYAKKLNRNELDSINIISFLECETKRMDLS